MKKLIKFFSLAMLLFFVASCSHDEIGVEEVVQLQDTTTKESIDAPAMDQVQEILKKGTSVGFQETVMVETEKGTFTDKWELDELTEASPFLSFAYQNEESPVATRSHTCCKIDPVAPYINYMSSGFVDFRTLELGANHTFEIRDQFVYFDMDYIDPVDGNVVDIHEVEATSVAMIWERPCDGNIGGTGLLAAVWALPGPGTYPCYIEKGYYTSDGERIVCDSYNTAEKLIED